MFAIVYVQHRWNENQTLNALNYSFQLYKVVRRHEHEPFCGWCWAQSKFSFFNYVSRCSHQPDCPETIFTIFLCVIIFVSFLLPRSLNFAFSFLFIWSIFVSLRLVRLVSACAQPAKAKRAENKVSKHWNGKNFSLCRLALIIRYRAAVISEPDMFHWTNCCCFTLSLCICIYAHKSDCSGNCREVNDDDRRLQSGRWLFVLRFFQIS